MLMSSGESLCIRLATNSVVLKTFLGTEVAADNRLIIVVFAPKREGEFAASDPPFISSYFVCLSNKTRATVV